MKLYVFDLDGTITNLNHRLPLLENGEHGAFLDACMFDLPNKWIIDLIDTLSVMGRILILTCRKERARKMTESWLLSYGVMYDMLLMREDDDNRPDWQVKSELLDLALATPDTTGVMLSIQFIMEDRQSVVDMWRARGFNVLQCGIWEDKQSYDPKEKNDSVQLR